MMIRLILSLATVLTLLLVPQPAPVGAASCAFVLGFKALHDLIPTTVGACLVDEHHNPTNGDGLQETTGPTGAGGLLVWRKADNWTAYTDGYHSWINGPLGLQERLNTERFPWEGDYLTFRNPTHVPVVTPTPSPVYSYYVETSSIVPQVRPGGAQTFCARLTAPGGPPVGGLAARLTAYGHDYFATTQLPDGNACVTVVVPVGATNCQVTGYITYNGAEVTEPGWAHHEGCTVLPF